MSLYVYIYRLRRELSRSYKKKCSISREERSCITEPHIIEALAVRILSIDHLYNVTHTHTHIHK